MNIKTILFDGTIMVAEKLVEPGRAMQLKAPFPWFGGKRRVAPVVWQALGDVDHYVEPFAGSLAVLLDRPTPPKIETVNDVDLWLINFWRAVQHDPESVASYADWPVTECDLTARHLWLVNEGRDSLQRCWADPDFYDTKIAGWWVWGLSAWIGSDWCSGDGPWIAKDGRLVRKEYKEKQGVKHKLPQLRNAGEGINRQLPHLGNPGQGINRQRPHLGCPVGINRKRPHLGELGRGVNRTRLYMGYPGENGTCSARTESLLAYMQALADRLRNVRICCGDWSRVVTPGALAHGTHVGIFLDPPYDQDTRYPRLYSTDEVHGNVSAQVRDWCLDNAQNPRYRIVLCGYEGEHDMPSEWRVFKWVAGASYKTHRGDQTGNRYKERIWFSPNCLPLSQQSFLEQ